MEQSNNVISKRNVGKTVGIIIGIIGLLMICISTPLYYLSNNSSKEKEETKVETKVEDNQEEFDDSKVKVVGDVKLSDEQIEDILKKMQLLTRDNMTCPLSKIVATTSFSIPSQFAYDLSNQMSEERMQKLTLFSLDRVYENMSIPYEELSEEAKKYLRQDLFGTKYYGEFKGEEVREQYKFLFGKEIGNFINSTNACSVFVYDSNRDYFYHSYACGGTGLRTLYYVNRIETSKKTANVFINIGKEDADIHRIDNTNYKNYKEYKFTFQKGSNNLYYYVSFE